jgi:hypothetical protein
MALGFVVFMAILTALALAVGARIVIAQKADLAEIRRLEESIATSKATRGKESREGPSDQQTLFEAYATSASAHEPPPARAMLPGGGTVVTWVHSFRVYGSWGEQKYPASKVVVALPDERERLFG